MQLPSMRNTQAWDELCFPTSSGQAAGAAAGAAAGQAAGQGESPGDYDVTAMSQEVFQVVMAMDQVGAGWQVLLGLPIAFTARLGCLRLVYLAFTARAALLLAVVVHSMLGSRL